MDFKVNDKVFSPRFGEGTVIATDKNPRFGVEVSFIKQGRESEFFTKDGTFGFGENSHDDIFPLTHSGRDSYYTPLFLHLAKTHDLILLDSEMDDIIRVVIEMQKACNKEGIS